MQSYSKAVYMLQKSVIPGVWNQNWILDLSYLGVTGILIAFKIFSLKVVYNLNIIETELKQT